MKILITLLSFFICFSSFAKSSEGGGKKYSITNLYDKISSPDKVSPEKIISSDKTKSPYNQISSNGFSDIIEPLLPAVVNISTSQTLEIEDSNSIDKLLENLPKGLDLENFRELLEKQIQENQELVSLGSGFIISKDGYVVTNHHVIDGATKITINLNNTKSFEAKIIGIDKRTDLALLKIDSKEDLPYVKMGDSNKSRIGEWVLAVGNPFGLGGSVSVGIISGHNRNINSDKFDDYIQTDAAINKGNSGGPLFNINGEVIGIATAIFSPSGGNVGIGFATPISNAKEIIEELKNKGEIIRGWIGVSIQDVSEEMAKVIGMEKPKGAFVVEVIKDGPAEKTGILPTDVIVKFDDKDINEMKDLPKIVSKTPIDKKVQIEVIRQGKLKTFKTKVEKLDEEKIAEAFGEESKLGKTVVVDTILGMDLANLTKEVKEENKIQSKVKGVLIVNIAGDSPAKKGAIEKGDIILSVNQIPIKSVDNIKEIIEDLKKSKKESILLFIKRERLIKTDDFAQQQSYNFTVILPLK